jgi:hypothetical protein
MIIPDFLLRFFGKEIGQSLKEGPMNGTKPWYQSKTIWTSIVSGVIGTYLSLLANGVNLPMIPPWIITILSGIGVYTRINATDQISNTPKA